MSILEQTISAIQPVDRAIEPAVRAHLDNLTKPQGSLGELEDLAVQYCLITGSTKPQLAKKRILVFAADHGVADEGISAFPKAVTAQMVHNMLEGGAAINVLARHAGAEVSVVDMGVETPLEEAPGLIGRPIGPGTANIAKGPAMTEKEAHQALETGIDLAREAKADGVHILGTGDMGIANTTPSTALLAALLPANPEAITGYGTGIDEATLARKTEVIRRALDVNSDSLHDPIQCLAALGGFEIAGITGLVLGAAAMKIPAVIDGFISSAAALTACAIAPHARGYLYFSHCSAEKGHRLFLEKFNARPILDLNLRLGEGTGAALAITIIQAAVNIYNEMATFTSAGVSENT